MATPSLESIIAAYPEPSRRRDPTGQYPNMEAAVVGIRRESRTRSMALAHVDLDDPNLNRVARRLSKELSPDRRKRYLYEEPTMASPMDMWRFRAGLAEAATPLITASPGARFVTLNPRGYSFSPEELLQFKPALFLRTIRADFDAQIRAMAEPVSGWVLGGIHGEYRPNIDRMLVHAHVITSEPMLPVIEGLRTLDKYRSDKRTPDNPEGMRRRIWVRDGSVDLSGLMYCAQNHWPSHWYGEVEPGNWVRSNVPQRMPEPAHSLWLLWMDRQRFSDLLLRYHCALSNGQIVAR